MIINKTSYALGFLKPNEVSAQRLSTGTYSLSARSNIPFARLLGKGIDKMFTWGEVVEVPFGQICTVVNASYHAGDLFINGGCDEDNQPARITVPVPVENTIDLGGGVLYWLPAYPADVRTARRAYLATSARNENVAANTDVQVIGTRLDGSHNTRDMVTGSSGALAAPGSGYGNIMSYGPGQRLSYIPLGAFTVQGDDTRPHALLTEAIVLIENNVSGFLDFMTAYYVMEY